MQRPRFDDEFTDLAALAYQVAYRILGDRSAAEDIAQESLARAYLRWTKITDYRQAWVARVSGNLAIDQIRRHKRSATAERHVDAEVLMIERLDLQRALLRLPKRQRDAVVLRYIADLSEADVAALLGCSPGTVKSHLNRGTSRLRLILDDAIGGVTVPVAYPLRDTATGLFVPVAGCTVFDGSTALAYVRSRHFEYQDATGVWHEDPSADLGRIARQQDFVERVPQSASSAGVLHPQMISALYSAYRNDMVVDTGLTIAKMIEFVGAISDVNRTDIHNYQIEAQGKSVAGSDVLVWNKDSVSNTAILNIFRGLVPLGGGTAPSVAGPTDTEAVVVDAPPDNIPATAIVPGSSTIC